MSARGFATLIGLALAGVCCGGSIAVEAPPDAGDISITDAGDSSVPDAGAGAPHDGGADAGAHDAGAHDAGADDAGADDAGAEDAGPRDAGAHDAGASDAGHDGGQPDAGAPDGGSACPADMVAEPGFCIDRYEAPNLRGEKPLAMQTAYDGEAFCAARGKVLCTEAWWVRACEGQANLPYPYGSVYRRGTCDDDKTWLPPDWTTLGSWPSAAAQKEAARLYQADASGARTGCASDQGVMDLTGNVAEWVVRSFDHANNFKHVMKGCYWSGCYGGSPPSCGFVNPAHPGSFRSYEAGFRCCKAR